MMKLTQLTAAAMICVLSACSSTGGSADLDFDSLKEQATASIKAARDSGYEWRDSSKILDKAEAAFNKGDLKQAVELAKQAKQQGDLAVAQAKAQQSAGSNY